MKSGGFLVLAYEFPTAHDMGLILLFFRLGVYDFKVDETKLRRTLFFGLDRVLTKRGF